jgi:UDP-N-acetyl-2-amino-2-deoxyglucuronate dehydrogenase
VARILNFGMVGAAGFVAPRHMKAIKDTGHRLIAAADKNDSVGVIDSYFPDARFFTEIERFDRHLEKLRRKGDDERLHYLSVCSPNYLHDAHIRLALRLGADAICEKPLVINPWNLDQLQELEAEHGKRVWTVMQLRYHPVLQALREKLVQSPPKGRAKVVLTYMTRRGNWYDASWKADESKSGGVAMNLGVHFFDLLQWMFGRSEAAFVHLAQPRRMAGRVLLERADVRWFLSIDHADLPAAAREKGKTAWRALSIDGQEVEFSEGFGDLHTKVYAETIAGRGLGIQDARPGIELLHAIRKAEVRADAANSHPLLQA